MAGIEIPDAVKGLGDHSIPRQVILEDVALERPAAAAYSTSRRKRYRKSRRTPLGAQLIDSEVFAISRLYHKTKRGRHAAFGPTRAGRPPVVVFAMKGKGLARVIAGWDMDSTEQRYYQQQRRR